MAFCTKCGTQLQENEIHTCMASQSSPEPVSASAPLVMTAREQLARVDRHKILNLLKNPMSALHLKGDSDWLYGLLGIIASLIGFVLWSWSFKHQLIKAMISQFGGLMRDDSKAYSNAYSNASEYMPIVNHMFVLGLVSLIVMLAAVFLLGSKLGTQRTDWKNSLVQLGGLQLVAGAVLIVAALVMFVSVKASFVLLLTTTIAALALTLYAGIELFRINRERAVWFIAVAVLIQVIAELIVFNSFGTELMDAFKGMGGDLF
ncbi:hypothetical protein [Paenibacillus dauci]|uniref:hypothetical protein n=1 Tax=Paenibacillus dauci TaxID=1567106 RepID=UPI00061A057A|nr:hypothetical protein [Paenibacillus dauci]